MVQVEIQLPTLASSKYDDMHWLIQILKRLGGGQKLLIDCLRQIKRYYYRSGKLYLQDFLLTTW